MQYTTHATDATYDCAIIGGGLGGLCLSIQLARAGLSVVLFEKQSYPMHRVCGEYVSMESWGYLTRLGVPLADLGLPRIHRLGISAESGFLLQSELGLGGFGISRHTLDLLLCGLARAAGVTVMERCRVQDVQGAEGPLATVDTTQGVFQSRLVCGSFGKYAPAFAKWEGPATPRANYIGVKHHIRTDFPADRIELHNFKDGYCGVSKVDGDRYCLCYLSKASNLQAAGNDLPTMEAEVLGRNPYLKRLFAESEFLLERPLVISNVYFQAKGTEHRGLLLLGDAAGAITPLCGNGMSMAMRAADLLAALVVQHHQGHLSRMELSGAYRRVWQKHFGLRIRAGYYLQGLMGRRRATDLALRTLHQWPGLTRQVVRLTHGQPW